ncbi:MAG: hypothetical protein IJ853_03960 [Rickettsiales bacterium]|nr:hypothetical protein [Rickettsiales bacterium]
MCKILSISTINKKILVLLQNDKNVIDEINVEEENKQAELLVASIEKILNNNKMWYDDIDCISVINGPGSFIGLKVAVAVVKAIKTVYSSIKIIENNVFELISYGEKFDYVILKADVNGYYLYDRNKNIKYIANSELQNLYKNKVISNVNTIENLPKDCKMVVRDVKADNLISLNYFKYKKNMFSGTVEALYIMDPKINKRKNE